MIVYYEYDIRNITKAHRLGDDELIFMKNFHSNCKTTCGVVVMLYYVGKNNVMKI
jgi:hypothetical protein